MPAQHTDLISDLESAFANGTPEKRLAALWHTTDLLLTGRYSEEEIWVFGEIIDKLMGEIELQARVKLAHFLSSTPNAPPKTIRKLAFDDLAIVANPVLSRSVRLDDTDLIEVASCKGQLHLLAITQRSSLSQSLTDVLVARGDQQVLRSVAKNEGARFSDSSFWHLVRRSEHDSILAECVGARKDIPRHQFQQLIAKASEEVKRRLRAINPTAMGQIEHAVSEVAADVHARFGPASQRYFAAKRRIAEMNRSGELREEEIQEFAKSGEFEEAIVALSVLCRVSADVAERALLEDNCETLMILGKSVGFGWGTIKLLATMRGSKTCLDAARTRYIQLTEESAKNVVTFYGARRKARN